MMDDSKKRFQIGFIGSLGFHLFVFLVLAFAGLFAANHVDDKIVEIAVFGGGGGGGGGGGSGMKPADATEADLAAAKANALQNKQHSASQPQQQIKKSGQINTDDIIEKTNRQEKCINNSRIIKSMKMYLRNYRPKVKILPVLM